MRDALRAMLLIAGTAWRTDWRRCLGTLLEPAGQAAGPLFGLFLALIVDGVVERKAAFVASGAVGIALFQSVSYLAGVFGISIRLTLSEVVGHAFDRQIASLSSALPGLEHHERPEYLDRLELLRQTQGVLGDSLNSLVRAAGSVITGLVTLAVLASAAPVLLVLAAFALPSLWAARVQQTWMGSAEERSAEPRRLAEHLRRLIGDHSAGAELRVLRIQSYIADRHRAAWLSAQAPVLAASGRQAVLAFAEQTLFTLVYGAAVGYMLWRATRGDASAGSVLLVAVVGRQVQMQVLAPIYAVAGLGQALRAAGRLLWLQDHAAPASPSEHGHHGAPPTLLEGIAMEGVSFRYHGSKARTLSEVSLRFPAGSVVALVGENGAGKSTLIKLLCRFYEPEQGRILIDGVDLMSVDVSSWRSRLSGAFQDFARFELEARRSVGVGDLPRMDDEEAVVGAIREAGAEGVLDALPHGLATQLGTGWDSGVELSAGQWQKLALSRALMRRHPLLVVFDEPTASLDAPTEHALFERYAAAARRMRERGTVTILVSHRFSTVRMADLIVVIAEGRIAEQGSHEELMALGGRYAELYGLQARSYRA